MISTHFQTAVTTGRWGQAWGARGAAWGPAGGTWLPGAGLDGEACPLSAFCFWLRGGFGLSPHLDKGGLGFVGPHISKETPPRRQNRVWELRDMNFITR